jgi:hypothetical protein
MERNRPRNPCDHVDDLASIRRMSFPKFNQKKQDLNLLKNTMDMSDIFHFLFVALWKKTQI